MLRNWHLQTIYKTINIPITNGWSRTHGTRTPRVLFPEAGSPCSRRGASATRPVSGFRVQFSSVRFATSNFARAFPYVWPARWLKRTNPEPLGWYSGNVSAFHSCSIFQSTTFYSLPLLINITHWLWMRSCSTGTQQGKKGLRAHPLLSSNERRCRRQQVGGGVYVYPHRSRMS